MLIKEVEALFLLAGIKVDFADELQNEYWPRVPEYQKLRDESPWRLVHTEFGMVKIGWRKRVISIEWSRTNIRTVVTEDDVTKGDSMVHAYSYAKALQYLTTWARTARQTQGGPDHG